MADYLALAAQLRATRQAEQQQRAQQAQMGGAASSSGGMVGQPGGGMFASGGQPQQQQQPQQENPLQTGLDAYNKYKQFGKAAPSAGGAFAGATPSTMAAMQAGGGSSLGSMGLMSSAPAVSFPGASTAGGSAAGAGGGAAGAAGGLGALAALGHFVDKGMNEEKGSFINADKLNNMGTIGGSGIGLRFGDFGNAFNPATWVSDPKKAGKAIVNAFTLGFLDKWM